jgi:DNA-directed RNA polymerase subunit N (RpoN/RPB10)
VFSAFGVLLRQLRQLGWLRRMSRPWMTVVKKNRQTVSDHGIKRYCCFRTASLELREAVQTRAEVLHDLAIVRTRWSLRSF